MSKRIHLNELNTEEHYALNYAIAQVGGPGSLGWRRFVNANEAVKKKMSDADMRAALQKGLNGLAAKGIIEVKKDGEGDYQPTILHLELLDAGSVVLQ